MDKLNAEQTSRAKAPGIMAQFIRDFPITPEDAAAVVDNLGHESAGFTALQEIKPIVAGSKGEWVGTMDGAPPAPWRRIVLVSAKTPRAMR